jgi:hypothetical protein
MSEGYGDYDGIPVGIPVIPLVIADSGADSGDTLLNPQS